jgi:hypothetical protein
VSIIRISDFQLIVSYYISGAFLTGDPSIITPLQSSQGL